MTFRKGQAGTLFLKNQVLTFRKDQQAAQREYKRKKSQKKAQRLKQLEEERESEKNKWLDFNVKVSTLTLNKPVKLMLSAPPIGLYSKVALLKTI